MATRATYSMEGYTFYCHWDGHPCGAAERFAKMIEAWIVPGNLTAYEARKGGLAFAFVRGVLDAEPTESHEAHGDTEYRYSVKLASNGQVLLVAKVRDHEGQFVTFYSGSLVQFVNQEREIGLGASLAHFANIHEEVSPDEILEGFPKLVEVVVEIYLGSQTIVTCTEEVAKQIAAKAAASAEQYRVNNPNKEINEKLAAAFLAAA